MWKLIFWLVEVNFFHFSDTPTSERYFCLVETHFQTNFSFGMAETDFLFVETVFSYLIFFSTIENFHQY